ncbi:unnamed protein product, partial [Ectocarpus sp. 6 AP-2014]
VRVLHSTRPNSAVRVPSFRARVQMRASSCQPRRSTKVTSRVVIAAHRPSSYSLHTVETPPVAGSLDLMLACSQAFPLTTAFVRQDHHYRNRKRHDEEKRDVIA